MLCREHRVGRLHDGWRPKRRNDKNLEQIYKLKSQKKMTFRNYAHKLFERQIECALRKRLYTNFLGCVIPSMGLLQYEDLLHHLSCSTCSTLVSPPVAQCRKGHLCCMTCRTNNSCRICKQTFLDAPNLALEKILSCIAFPCKYGWVLQLPLNIKIEILKSFWICCLKRLFTPSTDGASYKYILFLKPYII